MLHLEHSAILLTCIKRYIIGLEKSIFGLFESGRLTQVLLKIVFRVEFLRKLILKKSITKV